VENISNACPKCHATLEPGDYYCYNCGASAHPAPPSLSPAAQISLYAISFFLPPFGIFRGFKYLRQSDQKSKMVGIVSIALTMLSLVIAIATIGNLVNAVNKQINTQLPSYMGIY